MTQSWRRDLAEIARAAARADLLARSARVAAFVGSLLTVVNHPDLLTGHVPDALGLGRIAFTYFVPFCVATWSAAAQACARGRD